MDKIPNEHIAATHWPCGIEWYNNIKEPNKGLEFQENYHPESIDLLNYYQGYDYNYNSNEIQKVSKSLDEQQENMETFNGSDEFKNKYNPNYPEF